jgi:hypothetical protein
MKRGSSIRQKPHAANRQPKLSKSAKSLRQTGISLRLELGPVERIVGFRKHSSGKQDQQSE